MGFSIDSLDIYGSAFSLNINGKYQNKTFLGGIATIFSSAFLVVVVVLFGSDFFFRTNPRVISQKIIRNSSEMINPTTSTFPLGFRIEDELANFVDFEQTNLKLEAVYRLLERDSNGEMQLKHKHTFQIKKCTSLQAVKSNVIDSNFNLNKTYCVDWDEVTEFTPLMGGYWDEQRVGYLSLLVNNCAKKGREDCASSEEVKKLFEGKILFFSMFIPNYFFDPDDFSNPIQTYFENIFSEINAYTMVTDDISMQSSVLTDDKGWIFKDIQTYKPISIESIRSSFHAVIDDKKGNFAVYTSNFYFRKAYTQMQRSFVKVQELAAEVGGVIKLVHLLFGLVLRKYAKFRMMVALVETVKCKENNSYNTVVISNLSNTSRVEVKEEKPNFSFFAYFIGKYFKTNASQILKKHFGQVEKHFEAHNLLAMFKKNSSMVS